MMLSGFEAKEEFTDENAIKSPDQLAVIVNRTCVLSLALFDTSLWRTQLVKCFTHFSVFGNLMFVTVEVQLTPAGIDTNQIYSVIVKQKFEVSKGDVRLDYMNYALVCMSLKLPAYSPEFVEKIMDGLFPKYAHESVHKYVIDNNFNVSKHNGGFYDRFDKTVLHQLAERVQQYDDFAAAAAQEVVALGVIFKANRNILKEKTWIDPASFVKIDQSNQELLSALSNAEQFQTDAPRQQ